MTLPTIITDSSVGLVTIIESFIYVVFVTFTFSSFRIESLSIISSFVAFDEVSFLIWISVGSLLCMTGITSPPLVSPISKQTPASGAFSFSINSMLPIFISYGWAVDL